MIRVLFDAHQLGRRQTGNETYVREVLARIQDEPDIELIAAVERGLDATEIPGGPMRIRRVPRNGFARLAAFAILARQLRVDLVHAIYFLPPPSGRPAVVTIHDISYELYPEFFSRAALFRNRTLIRASARAATRVITVSETSRREISERYAVDESRIVAIPNGVGPPFEPEASWEPYSGGRQLRVLAVGTLEPRKNLVRLLEAVRLVHRDVPVMLRVVGPDGYQADHIRQSLAGIEAAVTGWVTQVELAREYRQADVFAYQSIYEGFGLPLLEAMASGTPVVASNGGSIPEVAGDAALLVDPFDIDGLAHAITRLATDPTLASTMRSRGIERAAEYTWQRSADAHTSLYRALVNE